MKYLWWLWFSTFQFNCLQNSICTVSLLCI